MIQYILECIAFQLVFLIIYDFFLKGETFFQLNRFYLIGTYFMSLILPWVKIEALKTTVPQQFGAYPEYLWNQNDTLIVSASESSGFALSWQETLFFGGMMIATFLFGYKLLQLYRLRKQGEIRYFNDFTRIMIANSNMVFSFFKSIFLGDKVLQIEHENIIKHELVHIRQRHTWDLLFFELMRILGWFNPLVYVYQNRISELHEFIADSEVVKANKEAHYQFLLGQVFQTQNISFINPFFRSSLIKKRIVMLQKSRSKRIWKLKYLALVPLILVMLFYTSCEQEMVQNEGLQEGISVNDIENLTDEEEEKVFLRLIELSGQPRDWSYAIKDKNSTITFSKAPEGSGISGPNGIQIRAKMHIESKVLEVDFDFFDRIASKNMQGSGANIDIPFAVIEEVPVFPGCENAADPRACFQEKIQRHISKHFRYPEEAQKLGIQGRVSTMFTISKDGNISNIRKRGPDKLLEDEVVRIIEKLPKMIPGRQEGRAVNVPFSIPITFKLQQTGFNPNSQDPDYIKLQNEQLSELSDDMQIKYKNAVAFAMVQNVPVFPGCENASDPRACFQEKIQRHIAKNFRYPEEAQEKGVQGRVSVLFLIGEDGNISNIRMRGPDKSLEDEAERIITRLPQMRPAVHQGRSVAVPFAIPINFKLQ